MPELEPKKRNNLRDVARSAGVSVATVSRVLNTPKQVSPATRDRVQQVMKELRFVPSAAARAINSGRTRMVAALLPTLDNSIYARVVDGLENRLAAFDLSLIVAQTHDDPAVELARARQLVDIGAEGFVVAGITHSAELLEFIDHIQVPIVSISYYAPDHFLPTIGYDNAEAARIAARHLEELGHRTVFVPHGPTVGNDRMRTRRATLDALETPMQFHFCEVPVSVEGGALAVDLMRRDAPDATAMLCFGDVLAMGAISGLHQHGMRVPEDVSVMGMEDLPSSAFLSPALTSVRLQVQEMGERAAEAIARWLEHQERAEPVYLKSELIARASTGPAPR